MKDIEAILELENKIVKEGFYKYQKDLDVVLDILSLISNCFEKYDDKELNSYIFFNGFKTHFILSVLSLLRKHKFEAFMNIRIMIEYIPLFLYCTSHIGISSSEFNNTFNNRKQYGFFDSKFPHHSKILKSIKRKIVNENFAHAGYMTGFM
ncbi:hypothetical protein N9J72_03305, partial [Candidatus Gracilibacteria bacterium]|nr:hypothetical protein [Candidatus Gracilibacteria bacterium]